MAASTIEDVAAAAGLPLPNDVVIEIDENEGLRGRQLYGYAWPDGLRITLYHDAFEDEEQLLRTLAHELVHVVRSVLMGRRRAPRFWPQGSARRTLKRSTGGSRI